MSDYNKLAAAILKAQEIREESYVHCHETMNVGGFNVPISGNYAKSHEDAAQEAAPDDPQTQVLVMLLNFQCWNDAYHWAKTQQAEPVGAI